jgi:hypothetical protein
MHSPPDNNDIDYRHPTIVHNHDKISDTGDDYYDLHFKNTKLIPKTAIIKYLKTELPIYLEKHKHTLPHERKALDIDFSQCFELGQLNKIIKASKKKEKI